MKRWGVFLSAILILAVTVTSAQATLYEVPYVSFYLGNVTPNIDGGFGTISQNTTKWYVSGSTATVDSEFVTIKGGNIVFNIDYSIEFTGSIYYDPTNNPTSYRTFTLSGFWVPGTYWSQGSTSGWDSVTLTNASVLNNEEFTVSFGNYEGSLSTASSGDPKKFSVTGDFSQVPIPSALILLGSGLVGLIAVRRKKNR